MRGSTFQAIADPTRRQILDVLHQRGPMRAGDLAARFPRISRPGVSKHLRVLRRARLLLQERRGRELWYQIDPTPLSQIDHWINKYEKFWRNRLQGLKKASEDRSE